MRLVERVPGSPVVLKPEVDRRLLRSARPEQDQRHASYQHRFEADARESVGNARDLVQLGIRRHTPV